MERLTAKNVAAVTDLLRREARCGEILIVEEPDEWRGWYSCHLPPGHEGLHITDEVKFAWPQTKGA